MSGRIIPIAELTSRPRIAELGRIRAGKSVETKKGWRRPVNSPTWILTAQTPENLEVLAGEYGGTVEEWTEGNKTSDRYRLITETETLHVVLPPDPLSVPVYERWDGGQIRRRCDGVTCTGWPKDGSPPVEVPCKCVDVDDSRYHCKIKQHLSVILPQCPVGVWRLSMGSMNAAREMSASVDIIRMASRAGLPRAVLTRREAKSGEKEYRVPVLTTVASFDELEAAANRSGAPALPPADVPPMAVPAGARAVLEAGPIDDDLSGPVDEVAPADVIDVAELADEGEAEGPNLSVVPDPGDVPGDPSSTEESAPALTDDERAVIEAMKQARPKPRRRAVSAGETSGGAGGADTKGKGREASTGDESAADDESTREETNR